ncbi:MAG: FMN-dependent NADH-azoreductase [Rhodospirillales bacterium]|nr:FMN-dependent NADH-azoreductase [Rhodospirillales bacterium]
MAKAGNVLFVSASAAPATSRSAALAERLIGAWQAADPTLRVTRRALDAASMPHLDGELLAGFGGAATPAAARSDALIAELEAADTLVIAVPLYNFSVPSTLKAWIDHIARAGRTFRYTETGPVGLLTGKRAVIVSARGGVYSQGPAAGLDFALPWLRAVLGFVGITEVEVVTAEGLAMGEAAAKAGLARAEAAVDALAA